MPIRDRATKDLQSFKEIGSTDIFCRIVCTDPGVPFEVTITGGGVSGVGCPSTTKKIRYDFNDDTVDIEDTLGTLFTRTGSGVFFEGVFDFDSSNIQVKFTVDGSDVVFDIEMNDLRDIQMPAASGQLQGAGGLEWENAGARLRFKPPCAIPYATSIKFEAIKIGGGPNKSMDRRLIVLTEET